MNAAGMFFPVVGYDAIVVFSSLAR